MAFRLPNGSSFDFEATSSDPITVTAISNAAEAIVSAADHDFVAGDIVVLTSGWVKLTDRTFRIKSVVADVSFVLEKVDTTDLTLYPSGSSAGTVRKILTWVNIPQITEVASSGGETQYYTFGFLAEQDDRQLPTTRSPSTLTLTIADDPSQPFVAVVEKADETREPRVQRLNLINGDLIFYYSIASMSPTPSLTRNALMTRTLALAQQGRITRYGKFTV